MNYTDMIEELREGMREHTARTEVPSDFAENARRIARRRSARRAAAAGGPLLAVAGVATVVATAGSHNPASSAGQSAHITEGGGQTYETAYVIRRVRSHLDAAGQTDVVETVEAGGNGNPGSYVTATSWSYTDQQSGVQYRSSAMVSRSGTNIYDEFIVGTPIDNGVRWQYTNLDPVQHLYAVSGNVGPKDAGGSDLELIKHELDSGQATRGGTATLDGQPTIKLRFREPTGSVSTLYVNSRTFEPVESIGVEVTNAQEPSVGTDTTTEKWLPATAANIANTQLAQVPAGYTQVTQSELEKANHSGR